MSIDSYGDMGDLKPTRNINVRCKQCMEVLGGFRYFENHSKRYWKAKISDLDWEINFRENGIAQPTCNCGAIFGDFIDDKNNVN